MKTRAATEETINSIFMYEWETRELDRDIFGPDPKVRSLIEEVNKSGKLEIQELVRGVTIRSTSYVGRVNLGEITIMVEPKLRGSPLLHLLRYAYGLRDLTLVSDAYYTIEEDGFLDLLIHQLIAESVEIISRGLNRSYRSVHESLTSPRGRIDFQATSRRAGLLEAIPCNHHPRIEDCLINQVLLQGLRLASALSDDTRLTRQAHMLAQLLSQTVGTVRLDYASFKRLKRETTRLTSAYEPALRIIKILIESQGISFRETVGDRVPATGFLFDMNRFFQALLSRFLNENLEDFVVQDEFRLKGMMSYLPDYNPCRAKAPTPRPDFMVNEGNRVLSVLDAKYRDLWNRHLPEDMLYQLSIYALSQSTLRTSTILYPTIERGAKEARLQICDPLSGRLLARVNLRPVDLLELDTLISSEDANGCGKSGLARALAFGVEHAEQSIER